MNQAEALIALGAGIFTGVTIATVIWSNWERATRNRFETIAAAWKAYAQSLERKLREKRKA